LGYLALRPARKNRKFDVHARKARMNIKFPTFLAAGCAVQHTIKTVNLSIILEKTMPNTNPIFNLKAVLKETGMGADTLRAWERRYGIPKPQRTPGGHRLYSEYDISLIKWLIARQSEGLSISRAVEMWREQTSNGKDPLETMPGPRPGSFGAQAIYLSPETGLDALRAQWLTACLNFNEMAAEQALNQAFSLYPVETVATDLIARGLSEIGMLWYENRASVQQEHFASSLAMRRINTLISAAPSPGRPHTILIGCPPNEWHNFSGLLLALLLRRRSLNVIYLGANVPAERFEETLTAVQPSLVVLTSQQLRTVANLQQTASLLSAHGATVVYGGRIFTTQPNLTKHIPGHYLGDTLEAGIEKIETLLVNRPDAPQVVPPSNEHTKTLKGFLLKRPLIENSLNEQILPFSDNPEHIANANQFLGDNIIAALQLGDLHYIDSELDWLETLIKVNYLPPQIVSDYLKAYANAIDNHLAENGRLLSDWLEQASTDKFIT
jgi:MerR family transcriptional regulator, light-induced transcriptional regulator